ncbi:tetraacyldisaccharide 4'-kinase [Pelagibacteraceae bacterium]|nr:tetraacyldisaccharide 4'-kinase [Pelagibacteraceae bacterium]
MKLYKPKFWDKKNSLYSILLYPLSLIVEFIIYIRKKFVKTLKFKIPIVCVGNIYIGGTGKTPLSILIAKELLEEGKKPAIIRKYYKNHIDEHNLIRNYFNNLILNKNRSEAIYDAQKNDFDIAILDDGFQDYKVQKNLNIICFNQNQLVGNGLIFPSGPLREKLSTLKNAQVVIINGNKDQNFEEKIFNINKNIKIFYSKYKPINIDEFKNKKLLAVAGIGNPNNFFKLLDDNDLNIAKKIIYPDHYSFKKFEILEIINKAEKENYQIIMTEKDYFKISKYKFNKIKYLKVKLEIDNKKELMRRILNVYNKNL